jgi:hypothetical protein
MHIVTTLAANTRESLAELEGHAGRGAIVRSGNPTSRSGNSLVPADASAVVNFWRQAGPSMWFAKDAAFDRLFRERFLALYEAAARGDLSDWLRAPESALALILLLDQYRRALP